MINKLIDQKYLQKYLGPLSSATSLGALCPGCPLTPVWTLPCVTLLGHFSLSLTLILPGLEKREGASPDLETFTFSKGFT